MILKVEKYENPFAQIDKRLINDPRLSWKAKGLIIYLLSKPNHWRVRVGDLVKRSTDGESAVRAAIKELEELKYISKERGRYDDGRFKPWEYVVREIPHGGFPHVDNPRVEKPRVENHPLSNNDLRDNEISDNDKRGAADAADPTSEAQPEPVKVKAEPKAKAKTPTPEAIKVFREEAHRFPAKSWWGDIVKAVGEKPDDLARWGETVHAWVGHGWNPTNVTGMLDCYKRQEIPGTKGRNGNNGNRQNSSGPPQSIPSFATGLGTPISDEFPDGWQPGDE